MLKNKGNKKKIKNRKKININFFNNEIRYL